MIRGIEAIKEKIPQNGKEGESFPPLHTPVMVDEVLYYLNPERGQVVVDATCGLGGHTRYLLERVKPEGTIVAVDRDAEILEIAKRGLRDPQVLWIHGDFKDLVTILSRHGLFSVDGVLFDLGVSSFHLDHSLRGFRYMSSEEILDMRFDRNVGLPASHYLNTLREEELGKILFLYGEEPQSRKIAQEIISRRRKTPFRTTGDLNEVLARVVKRGRLLKTKMRVYQALRIFVNDELYRLYKGLYEALKALKIGGRLVVISYHSLEERFVKRLSRLPQVEALTKKPLPPSQEEVIRNPRARSAKLRALKKIEDVNYEDYRRNLWPLVPPFGPGPRE